MTTLRINSTDTGFVLDNYYQYCPLYTKSFYPLIFDYNNNHGGQWDTAHEVGAGGGNVAKELGQHFQTVPVNDPYTKYINTAKAHLLRLSPDREYTDYQFANKRTYGYLRSSKIREHGHIWRINSLDSSCYCRTCSVTDIKA